jgi:hypothetical protein
MLKRRPKATGKCAECHWRETLTIVHKAERSITLNLFAVVASRAS